MNLNSCKLIVLVSAILLPGTVMFAAESTPITEIETPTEFEAPIATDEAIETETPLPSEAPIEENIPAEIDPADTVEAGKAKHAFKTANPCEGMAEGEYMGLEVCADCHQDKIETMQASPHGQAADSRSPFGQHGCETCHGPGEIHFKTEGNCAFSMTGRYGEGVEQRNNVCLGCHKGGERMHWLSSTHEVEGLACVSCHSIHERNDVIHRTSQTEVCFKCHKDIRAQTFRASTHPIQENKVICSDCHNAHGSVGPSSLKQYTINENCYSCHAEKRGPFLWEHYPASEDCTLCHRVHGSNHQALLNKPGPQLCQQCHATVLGTGAGPHVNNFYDLDETNAGRMRFIVGANCANCHSKVHGSNHPSGVLFQR
jgi:DmsE family decaheme c-type cytochrome